MKLLFVLLPLLGCALGLAQDLQSDNCVATCPPPNCPADDALEACNCLNDREHVCKAKCPEYVPRILRCPRLPVSTVNAPEPAPNQCVCEEVFCTLSLPEGCYCRNNATQACFQKCGGEEPTYQDCSVLDAEARALEPEPVPVPASVLIQAPQAETCVCEDVICVLSFPEGCYCRNNATKTCFEKCGGQEPMYQDCSLSDAEAHAPEPVTVAEPAPQIDTCVCEDIMCIQSWPDSCYCGNNADRMCFEKCGGEEPVYQNCTVPIDFEARATFPDPVPVPEALPAPMCECPLVNCIASWPESCYCQNAANERCHQLCGGTEPVLQVCPPYPSSTLLTLTATSAPFPTPTTHRQSIPTNQICGGGRAGQVLECPVGQVCITDPFQPGSCGPACDQLGICVGEKFCGGIADFKCDDPRQVCVDDTRDDCDPLTTGSDCGGLCAWPQ